MLKETSFEQALATIAGRRPSQYAGGTSVDIKTIGEGCTGGKPAHWRALGANVDLLSKHRSTSLKSARSRRTYGRP
eukprot:1452910-Amphidinium_carterae.1